MHSTFPSYLKRKPLTILQFEVSVDDSEAVQVLKREDQLRRVEASSLLWETPFDREEKRGRERERRNKAVLIFSETQNESQKESFM